MWNRYHYQHVKKRKNNRLSKTLVLFIAIGATAYLFGPSFYSKADSSEQGNAPSKTEHSQVAGITTEEPEPLVITNPLPWPSYGQAAYAVPEDNLFSSSIEPKEPVPIASLAKIITVLAILEEKPLNLGEQGPTITMDKWDADLVEEYARKDGTYSSVLEGTQITQYQALQSILMVSSNNMSDSMVRWAFGSIDAYIDYANKMLKDYGLNNTVVADDASGYSHNNISTPEDMAILGELFIRHPVLREITTQPNATIPVMGVIPNYNDFINHKDIIGLKLGNTDEAGKCFVAASIRQGTDGSEEISVAVILGGSDFMEVAEDAKAILQAGNKEHDLLTVTSRR